MLTEFQSICYGYFVRMNVFKQQGDLTNDNLQAKHVSSYQAGPTARIFTAADRNEVLVKMSLSPRRHNGQ